MTTPTKPQPQAFGWPTLLALAAALALLLGLGTWQLQRKQWKDALLVEIAARSAAPPLSILPGPVDPKGTASNQEYARVRLTGSFQPGAAHIFISVPRQPNGIGGPGYWLFQAFRSDANWLYVNRGFIPEADKARDFGAPQNITIEGIWRLPEPRGRFANANDPAKNVFYVRAPAEWDRCAQCVTCGCIGPRTDAYLDLTAQTPPPATAPLPLPLVGKIAIPNRHLEYALTWYALSATLVGVAFAVARRQRT